ncbi:dicarboxylate/amino acid:cation symporter [Echinimonas agarilytica]|uniref:Dicarboxylate/amino acid:cation symporter n=1 Tax=Echinimonas agarilytica TaxID=1215918 RepID=A0AA42B7Q6_9GAMM|nr:dicarboxylate/amino acid:cation symporter [Echinimonas agarilytica]MCM2680470.1 dicarboxylate/amino acid:cation symporter [Echinimonas agarilytica]
MKIFSIWFAIPFWQRVLAGFVLGAIAGFVLGDASTALKPLGDIFVNAIRMLIVPLVFCTLIVALTSYSGKNLGKIGVKTVGLFLFTAFIASCLGLFVGTMFDLGAGIELTASESVKYKDIPTVASVLIDIIPRNPIAAMAEGNILQVLFFAILVGISINVVGDKAKTLKDTIHGGAEVMFQITRYVMELTPFGVFGLIAWMVGTFGFDAMLPLAKFVGAIYLACLFHMLVVYGSIVKFIGKTSPIKFFRSIFPAQLVAYSSSSSYGTLPVTTQCVTENLGVSKSYSSFVLPLGATINMDGCGGIYPAIASIFIAQIYGISLDTGDYILIMTTAVLASVGTAGVPGSAMVMLTVTLNVVGLPLEGIAFIAAIDRIIDMMRTTTNITGDAAVALAIAKHQGLMENDIGSESKAFTPNSSKDSL